MHSSLTFMYLTSIASPSNTSGSYSQLDRSRVLTHIDVEALLRPFISNKFSVDQVDSKDVSQEDDSLLLGSILGFGDVSAQAVERLERALGRAFVDVCLVSHQSYRRTHGLKRSRGRWKSQERTWLLVSDNLNVMIVSGHECRHAIWCPD